MLTQQQNILMQLLKCGERDLLLLEKIKYDLYDIINELVNCNDLSLNSILLEVFVLGADDLGMELVRKKDEIEELIKEEAENSKEALSDLELLQSGELKPTEDIDYHCNGFNTHVFMKNIDFYKRWMKDELEEIEENMGWKFEESWKIERI